MKNLSANVQAVFYSSKVCLPSQIFVNKDFQFLITLGGTFVDNENEYIKLLNVLNDIGEKYICLFECTDNQYAINSPFKGEIKTNESFSAFRQLETTFDPHFGLVLSSFYIFGENPNWGVYLCEYPAIKLIGCTSKYISLFKDAFNIKGTGFEDVAPLLNLEFGQNQDFQNELIENYHL